VGGVVERHLERIRTAADFEGTFAAIARLIREKGAEEALDLALLWCAADESSARAAGLDVLSALAQERDDVLELAVNQAAAVAAGDEDEDLRWSAAHLLGSLPHMPVRLRTRALQELLRFEADPDGRRPLAGGVRRPLPGRA
jgi:uncharacterized protein (DUF952 family)